MTESCHEQACVRYFCTAGNGMELFLMDEVKKKLAAQNVVRLQGKVLFSSSSDITSIINLKSAERLFLLLKHDTPLQLPSRVTQAKAASLLHRKLIAQDELTRAAILWNRLQGELKDKAVQRVSIPKPLVGAKRRWEAHDLIDRDECDEGVGGNSEQADGNKKARNEEESMEDKKKQQDLELEKHYHHDEPQSQLRPPPVDQISFRISCKCSGSVARYFSSEDVSKILGTSVTTLLRWRVDLKKPHFEVNVNLSDDYCLMGVPLTKSPLANRSYLKHTGLRSTIAWAMASLAQIQPGYFVVDPMCGVGTILIEAAQEHSDTFMLGIDNDDEQLAKANRNVAYAHLEDRMQVLKASSFALPLHSSSVDAIICDMPFGHKFGTKVDAAMNLSLILSEMARVLRIGGTLVLLQSPQLSCLAKKLLKQDGVKSDSPQEKETPPEEHGCLSVSGSFTNQLFSQGCINGTLTTNGPERTSGQNYPMALSSLRHEQSFRVSLGAIDGLINKFVKSDICSK